MTGARIRVRTAEDLRYRRYRAYSCWDHLLAETVERGNTLRRPGCVHWVRADPCDWLSAQRAAGSRIVGVELAEEAVRLADLPPARGRTVAVLGHESTGIPPEALDLLDTVVEIPMVGTGHSLNVAVAGSLVLYRLAGLL